METDKIKVRIGEIVTEMFSIEMELVDDQEEVIGRYVELLTALIIDDH